VELCWRCLYPFAAALFLVIFFCGVSQGTELLKIFIAGERTRVQHWSLSLGFAAAALAIWWVSRTILLTPWKPYREGRAVDRVSLCGVTILPALLALIPMLVLTVEVRFIERTSQSISASPCFLESVSECKPLSDPFRPGQPYLFSLCIALLLAVFARAYYRHWGLHHHASLWTPKIRRPLLASVIVVSGVAFALWLLFIWSGPSAGPIDSAHFARHQMYLQRWLGSVFIIIVAVISVTVFGGLILTAWPKRVYGYSLVALPLLLSVLSSGFRHSDNNLRTLTNPPTTGSDGIELTAALSSFYDRLSPRYASADRDVTIPIYLVAASGGGLRAAYWTGAVLGDLQDQNPAFSEHLFVVSGVSGGGLGAATFIAGQRAGCPRGVTGSNTVGDSVGDSAGDCMRRILEDISLSPVLGGALYSDFWRSLWPAALHSWVWDHLGFHRAFGPYRDRAQVLEHTWETSFAFCSQRPKPSKDDDSSVAFARPFRCATRPLTAQMPVDVANANTLGLSASQLWKDHPGLPHLIINGTDAATGRRILSSNLRLKPSDFPDAYVARTDNDGLLPIPLSTLVHNGARFPVVSPAGRIANPEGRIVLQPWSPGMKPTDAATASAGAAIAKHARFICKQPEGSPPGKPNEKIDPCQMRAQTVHRIVDGGYFDNSGMVTLNDVLRTVHAFNRTLSATRKRPLRPAVIVVSNEGWSYSAPSGNRVGAFAAVIGTYTRAPDARAAHGTAERINRTRTDSTEDTFVFNLDRAGTDVPGLGWALSEASTNQMIIASASASYHARVRATLEALAPATGDMEARTAIGEGTRIARCARALDYTTLGLKRAELCSAPEPTSSLPAKPGLIHAFGQMSAQGTRQPSNVGRAFAP
jgi:hypothetical protein